MVRLEGTISTRASLGSGGGCMVLDVSSYLEGVPGAADVVAGEELAAGFRAPLATDRAERAAPVHVTRLAILGPVLRFREVFELGEPELQVGEPLVEMKVGLGN